MARGNWLRSVLARGRWRSERGAGLVEFALLLPILLALIFGVIDFSASYASLATLRQGTRDGARQIVVADVGTDGGCTLTGTGLTATDNTALAFCRTKKAIGFDDSNTRVKLALPAGTYAVKQPMLLCVEYPKESLTGFFSALLSGSYHAKVQMRIEAVTASGGNLIATQETALPGDDWTWCK
jgi:hypothetical protein